MSGLDPANAADVWQAPPLLLKPHGDMNGRETKKTPHSSRGTKHGATEDGRARWQDVSDVVGSSEGSSEALASTDFHAAVLLQGKRKRRCVTREAEADKVFEVEAILDEKRTPDGDRFLVRWRGYGEEGDTWEPIRPDDDSLGVAAVLVESFREAKSLASSHRGSDYRASEKRYSSSTLLWCCKCDRHFTADSFSARQRSVQPELRACLAHHYKVGLSMSETDPRSDRKPGSDARVLLCSASDADEAGPPPLRLGVRSQRRSARRTRNSPPTVGELQFGWLSK